MRRLRGELMPVIILESKLVVDVVGRWDFADIVFLVSMARLEESLILDRMLMVVDHRSLRIFTRGDEVRRRMETMENKVDVRRVKSQC